MILGLANVGTVSWSPKTAIVMIICNIVMFAVGKFVIQKPNVGPAPNTFLGMSLAALIGTACLGHIVGAGVILGLANVGTL
ncbi:photosystem I reaction center subunit X [Limnoraphis robusta CS-951]|uniref:Photosystem I reaction center subunit PsaK n=1 Tax=Limnoraphis robusta CS-951 TaxID=1637645 RepID=A0A0J9EYY6_9CYAN|nr:photosystem I reaction center subunit X [Limnoraphis robusta CS-951]